MAPQHSRFPWPGSPQSIRARQLLDHVEPMRCWKISFSRHYPQASSEGQIPSTMQFLRSLLSLLAESTLSNPVPDSRRGTCTVFFVPTTAFSSDELIATMSEWNMVDVRPKPATITLTVTVLACTPWGPTWIMEGADMRRRHSFVIDRPHSHHGFLFAVHGGVLQIYVDHKLLAEEERSRQKVSPRLELELEIVIELK